VTPMIAPCDFVIGTVAAITGVWLGISTILGQMLVAVALLLFVTGAMRTKRVRKLLGGHGGRAGGNGLNSISHTARAIIRMGDPS